MKISAGQRLRYSIETACGRPEPRESNRFPLEALSFALVFTRPLKRRMSHAARQNARSSYLGISKFFRAQETRTVRDGHSRTSHQPLTALVTQRGPQLHQTRCLQEQSIPASDTNKFLDKYKSSCELPLVPCLVFTEIHDMLRFTSNISSRNRTYTQDTLQIQCEPSGKEGGSTWLPGSSP